MEERRFDRRNRILKAGRISFGGSAIDCTVRNVGASGALLEVESPVGIPRRFTLLVPDSFSGDCRVIWIREKRLGVRFERPTKRDEHD